MARERAETCGIRVKAQLDLKQACVMFDETSVVYLVFYTTG